MGTHTRTLSMKSGLVLFLALACVQVYSFHIVGDDYKWEDISKAPSTERSFARSVCLIVSSDHVKKLPKSLRKTAYTINKEDTVGSNFKESYYMSKDEGDKLCDTVDASEVAPFTAGTAFVQDDGNIFTARHVVEECLREVKNGTINLKKKQSLRGDVFCIFGHTSMDSKIEVVPLDLVLRLGTDEQDDIVLKPRQPLDLKEHPALHWGQVNPQSGSAISTIGFPLGRKMQYSKGVTVAFKSFDDDNDKRSFIRGRMTIFQGNSGGPVFQDGKVVAFVSSGAPIDPFEEKKNKKEDSKDKGVVQKEYERRVVYKDGEKTVINSKIDKASEDPKDKQNDCFDYTTIDKADERFEEATTKFRVPPKVGK